MRKQYGCAYYNRQEHTGTHSHVQDNKQTYHFNVFQYARYASQIALVENHIGIAASAFTAATSGSGGGLAGVRLLPFVRSSSGRHSLQHKQTNS